MRAHRRAEDGRPAAPTSESVVVSIQIEPDRQVNEFTCADCGEPIQRVTGFIARDQDAFAVYFASCYHHNGHEAWIDVICSPTWAGSVNDRETFGCRVGPVDGRSEPGASLVTGGAAFSDSETFGRKLTRDEALTHPRLPDFWEVVDHILTRDPLVREHVYGPDAVLDTDT